MTNLEYYLKLSSETFVNQVKESYIRITEQVQMYTMLHDTDPAYISKLKIVNKIHKLYTVIYKSDTRPISSIAELHIILSILSKQEKEELIWMDINK